jgi:hypothetical protein
MIEFQAPILSETLLHQHLLEARQVVIDAGACLESARRTRIVQSDHTKPMAILYLFGG